MAQRAGMSTRNFARVFRRDVKLTPAGFVDAARIDAARRMLADTKFPLQRIARTCGWSLPTYCSLGEHVDCLLRSCLNVLDAS